MCGLTGLNMKGNRLMEREQYASQYSMDTVMDLIYLIRCAISRTKPDTMRVTRMDQRKLYEMAFRHSLAALVGSALEGTVTGEMGKRWKTTFSMAVRKTVLFDAERRELLSFMEENGIWYMALKGVVLKNFYPVYGTRQMADNDILFDMRFDREVRDWFRGRGYKVKKYARGVHDTYHKDPVYNFEMHRMLFSPSREKWYAYYSNVKDRLIKDEGNGYGYHFTDEDFYIYFFTHAAKHLTDAGTGLRSLVDLYLYTSKKPDLDWVCIERELKELGLKSNEREMRELANTLFACSPSLSEPELSPRQQKLLSDIVSSGSYGTVEKKVGSRLKKYAKEGHIVDKKRLKLQYLRKRFFPTTPGHRRYYAFYYQHWWARPLLPFVRFGKMLVKHRQIRKEFEALRKY